MAHVLQLYQLQSLDSEIDQINQQLAEIATRLGESDALKQARAAVEVADASLRKTQTKMRDMELEVKSLGDKMRREEKLLYSGRVLNAKEAANLQEEVRSLKRRLGEREEHLLETMMDAEEKEERLEAAQAELAEIEADWNRSQNELLAEKAALEKQLLARQDRRPDLAARVDADELAVYEKLRAKKNGRAVALVKGGVCQVCGMTPSNSKLKQARAGTELTYCGACGRILYVP